MVLQSGVGAKSVNWPTEVLMSAIWFQVSPLLRLMAKADSSIGFSPKLGQAAPTQGANHVAAVVVGYEPVAAKAICPSAFQPTRAPPLPKAAQADMKPAAPGVGFKAGYQKGMGQVVGESVKIGRAHV